MCGIAGFIHFDKEHPSDPLPLKRMCNVLKHRGPDGEGFLNRGPVALGHRRLAIIDLDLGGQPMFSADGRLAIVFNGEIYNYIELREDLKKRGYLFRTQSDTEVILASYSEWGSDCVTHFNGMWAFALWDQTTQTLFCSRDRIGEKPFFYAIVDRTFIFGSELKALFAYGVDKQIATEVMDIYLSLTYIPAPYTFFRGISKLRPGHSLLVHGTDVRVVQYWDAAFARDADARLDESAVFEEFNELFHDAVRIRMRSDVQYGAFLSGGLDSGSVVAAMSRYSESPVKTFTIGSEDAVNDERYLARLVSKAFKTDHLERVVTSVDAEGIIDDMAHQFDEPFGDSSALPTFIVSRLARSRVKMALSGDGGDEVLSGYTIFQAEKLTHMLRHFKSVVAFAPAVARVLGGVAPNGYSRTLNRLAHAAEASSLEFAHRLEVKQNGFGRDTRAAMLGGLRNVRPVGDFIEEALQPVRDRDNMTKLNYWLTKVGLPDDMLCKVDRTSMANSLEVRVPFLDHRLVELLASVSMRVKLAGYKRKNVLRATVGKQLPHGILRARKRGFGVPIALWLQNGGVRSLEERALMCGRGGALQMKPIELLVEKNKTTERENGNALWALAIASYHL
jgi:asparagine synthase (glutamine-hydrolysing)